jgi:hypothetical protein
MEDMRDLLSSCSGWERIGIERNEIGWGGRVEQEKVERAYERESKKGEDQSREGRGMAWRACIANTTQWNFNHFHEGLMVQAT